MHKSFYASGFIYSPKLHQILLLKLQKEDSTDFLWSTFGGVSSGEENPQIAFKRIIDELLGLNIKAKDIYPIYDYFHEAKDKINYVFYVEINNPRKFNSLKEGTPALVTFSEISKLPFTGHAKQDVIVGERVINAKWRDDEAKKLATTAP